MASENKRIQDLFKELCSQPIHSFPEHRKSLTAPPEPGVYITRKRKTVLHVGRTLRARDGLHQRLKNHLYGSSSFTNEYLNGKGAMLREKAYTYQYFVVQDSRLRALLEAYAVGILCPKHIGLGD